MLVENIVEELQAKPEWRDRVPGDPKAAGALLERGNGKDILHVLPDRTGAPTVVVKYERSMDGSFRIDREARNLQRLKDQAPIEGTPREWTQLTIRGRNALALPYYPGQSLLSYLSSPRSRFQTRRYAAALDRAAAWLLTLQTQTRTRVKDAASFAQQHRMLTEEDARLVQAMDTGTLELAAQHGDFNPANILIQGSKLQVIDWEWADLPGLPLVDLFNFTLRVAMLRSRIGKRRGGLPQKEDLIRAFRTDPVPRALCQRWVPRFSKELGIAPEACDDLFRCFARHTVGGDANVSLREIL